MSDLGLQSFNKLYPMVIKKYQDLVVDQNANEADKINSIIQKLNALGKLSNDVVRDWNTVYQWAMNDGLSQDVSNKIEEMKGNGELNTVLQGVFLALAGDMTTLHTSAKNTLVASINEVDDLAKANQTAINTNTANIATNTANIATNTTNIASNTSTLAQKASQTDLNTANANITTNTTNITANTSAINDIVIDVKHPPNGLTPCKVDGVTNDSTAFQAIVNYVGSNGRGTVLIPSGTMVLSNISIPSGVRIRGAGMAKTTINLASYSSPLFVISYVGYIEIDGVTIDFKSTTFTTNVFNMPSPSYIYIHNILIKNYVASGQAIFDFYLGNNIHIYDIFVNTSSKSGSAGSGSPTYIVYCYNNNQNVYISRVLSDNANSSISGFFFDNFTAGNNNINISDCYINGFEFYGVNVEGSTKIRIKNCDFLNATTNNPSYNATTPPCAIKIYNCSDVTIDKNRVTDAGEIGVYLTSDYVVSDNHVLRPVSAGIECNANDFGNHTYPTNNFRGKIVHNVVDGAYNASNGGGIFFEGGDGVISNNVVRGGSSRGITVAQNAANVVVSNNVVKNCNQSVNTQAGIAIGLSADVNPTQNVMVSNNLIFDDQATPTQAYGIQVFAQTANVTLSGNNAWGNTTTNLQIDSTAISKTFQIGNSWNPRTVYGTVAPTTGTYKLGDRCINSTPTVGNPKSWVCTVAGTPGTWVSEGNL